jgi:transcriptional regulator with XRE-family HTH domain
MNTYNIIKRICEEKNITFAKLERECKIANGIIRKWENTQNPSAEAIIKIADYFNLSTDYLFGLSDTPNPPAQAYNKIDGNANIFQSPQSRIEYIPNPNTQTKDELKTELIKIYEILNPRRKTKLLQTAYDLEAEQANDKKEF